MSNIINNIDNDIVMSFLKEEYVTDSSETENDNTLYLNYMKKRNNDTTKDSNTNNNQNNINNEKSKNDYLSATSLFNNINSNPYQQLMPLSPPQDQNLENSTTISPTTTTTTLCNNTMINNQNLSPRSMVSSDSPDLDGALSPSSFATELNDVLMRSDTTESDGGITTPTGSMKNLVFTKTQNGLDNLGVNSTSMEDGLLDFSVNSFIPQLTSHNQEWIINNNQLWNVLNSPNKSPNYIPQFVVPSSTHDTMGQDQVMAYHGNDKQPQPQQLSSSNLASDAFASSLSQQQQQQQNFSDLINSCQTNDDGLFSKQDFDTLSKIPNINNNNNLSMEELLKSNIDMATANLDFSTLVTSMDSNSTLTTTPPVSTILLSQQQQQQTLLSLPLDLSKNVTPLPCTTNFTLSSNDSLIFPDFNTELNGVSFNTIPTTTMAIQPTAETMTSATLKSNIHPLTTTTTKTTTTTTTSPSSILNTINVKSSMDKNSIITSSPLTAATKSTVAATTTTATTTTTTTTTANSNTKDLSNNDLLGSTLDVSDILKSDVAESCLNLLKGSKGKPGRKKKCIQHEDSASSHDEYHQEKEENHSGQTSANMISSDFSNPLSSGLNNTITLNSNTHINSNSIPSTNSTTPSSSTLLNPLSGPSLKYPIIKPKISPMATDSKASLMNISSDMDVVHTFNGSSDNINSTPKPMLNTLPGIIRNPPILPNGNTIEKMKTGENSSVPKTAYQKRQERLLKNREAAHLSRKRKREQLHLLETHAQELIAENKTLKLKVIELEQINENLVKENEILKNKIKENKESGNLINNDIYNMFIKSETDSVPTPSSSHLPPQQNQNSVKKEIGVVFMVLLFSFSLFTFPFSMLSSPKTNELSASSSSFSSSSSSLMATLFNKFIDHSSSSSTSGSSSSSSSTSSILTSSENSVKVLSDSVVEKKKRLLLESGREELDSNEKKALELADKEKLDLTHYRKSKKEKSSRSGSSKNKHRRNSKFTSSIKRNFEYTSFNDIASLMKGVSPKNFEIDSESLKQVAILQQWLVEGFCELHEDHEYAKILTKDIIKTTASSSNDQKSTDLSIKKPYSSFYESSKPFSKDIPWNMRKYIKFYPDTNYFYSPKLIQLFPLSSLFETPSTLPVVSRLQQNDTTSDTTSTTNTTMPNTPLETEEILDKREEEEEEDEDQTNDSDNYSSKTKSSKSKGKSKKESSLPSTRIPRISLITRVSEDRLDSDYNNYLMIDFEVKGARLIETE